MVVVPLVAGVVFVLLIALSRVVRRVYSWIALLLDRWMGARAARAVGWTVVVARGVVTVPWAPSPTARTAQLHRSRSAATDRSHDVALELRVEGPLALWSPRTVPVVATAALAAPELMLHRIAGAGLTIPDMHVVVTPHRPVVCTTPGVARRLAGQASEESVTLPWRDLVDLPWV